MALRNDKNEVMDVGQFPQQAKTHVFKVALSLAKFFGSNKRFRAGDFTFKQARPKDLFSLFLEKKVKEVLG